MKHKIGLIGCGTVGQGLLEILDRKAAALRERHGFEATVVAISDKLKGSVLAPDGLDIKAVLGVLGAGKTLDAYPGGKGPAARSTPWI